MAKYIISEWVHNDGTHIYKVRHDINGNPRYIVHHSVINADFDKSVKMARNYGFFIARKKEYKGYLMITTFRNYNGIYNLIQEIKKSITT